jgi:hypothetical protein
MGFSRASLVAHNMDGLINFIAFTLTWVWATAGLFDGVRTIAKGESTRRTIWNVTALTIAFIGLGSAYLYAHSLETKLLDRLEGPYTELAATWGGNMKPEEREKASLSYVSAAYLGTGKLFMHFDRMGQLKAFSPSQEQMKERESAVEVKTQLREQANSFFDIGMRWFASGLLAAMLGWATGRRKKAATNPTVERDARKDGAPPSP